MDDIFFSVVIPLYNKENHIKRAMDSVLDQSYQKFELIIVDDGSTDKGVAKVEEYSDIRIKLIKQKNQGVSAARNKGIREAKHNYIGLLDADDEWDDSFLAEILSLIKKYPEMGGYATSYKFITRENNKEVIPEFSCFIKSFKGEIKNYFKYSLKDPLISASSVVIPKKIFNKTGYFDEALTKGEDLDLWYRIALEYNFAFSSEMLVTYHKEANNRTSDREYHLKEEFVNKLAENIDNYYKTTNEFEKKYINKRILKKSKSYIMNNKMCWARKLLRKTTIKNKYLFLLMSYLPFFIIVILFNLKKFLFEFF